MGSDTFIWGNKNHSIACLAKSVLHHHPMYHHHVTSQNRRESTNQTRHHVWLQSLQSEKTNIYYQIYKCLGRSMWSIGQSGRGLNWFWPWFWPSTGRTLYYFCRYQILIEYNQSVEWHSLIKVSLFYLCTRIRKIAKWVRCPCLCTHAAIAIPLLTFLP